VRPWTALVIALATSACGRIAFDARSDATAGDVPTDAADGSSADPDLVVHFPLEGGTPMITDVVGGLEGSCATTCPTSAATSSPLGGTATEFDGIADCYVVADDLVLRQSAFTLALWARHDVTRNDSMIGKLRGPVAMEGNSFQLETGDGGVWPADAVVFASGTGINEFLVQLDPIPALTTWHHVAATFDGVTKRLYIDGVASGQASGAIDYDNGAMTIGCDQNAADQQYWDGDLDDVRIYRRVLTAAEILELATP
jgi:hypothetical protein